MMQQARPVALLGVDAHVRLPGACGHLPVHVADVIAGQVAAHLLEVQPTPAQPRRVAAREDRVHRLARQEREPLRLELKLAQDPQVCVHRVRAPGRGTGGAKVGGDHAKVHIALFPRARNS
jgi:hypothetical protein